MTAPFRFSVRVYYEDTDFSGVVYHAAYLKFFERARTEALRACGIDHSALLARPEPIVFAVRQMTIDWLAPARIDDQLDVITTFKDVRGARMFLDQEIDRDATRLARARVEAAVMTLAGRPRRLPAELKALLNPGL